MAERRIGIPGSGDVATALGRGFAKYGWAVKLGTRSTEKLRAWSAETDGTVGSFSDAASFGDVVRPRRPAAAYAPGGSASSARTAGGPTACRTVSTPAAVRVVTGRPERTPDPGLGRRPPKGMATVADGRREPRESRFGRATRTGS